MRKFWMFAAVGIAGLYLYKNWIRRTEWNPAVITTRKGDAPNVPGNFEFFKLTSPAFAPGQMIPKTHACDGMDKSPPLVIHNTPEGTQSFALILEDLDSPMPPIFDHWLAWNIPGDTVEIPEGNLPAGSVQGRNTLKNNYYNGPCTPNGRHYYHFKLYALDCTLDLPEGATKKELRIAMRGHVLAETELIGQYEANPITQGNLMLAMTAAAAK